MFGFFKINEDLFFEELLLDDIDIDKIQKYINKGVNINKRDEKGQTILFTLAAKRKLESLKILIRNGANLTIEDNHRKTVLDEAVDRGDGMMIRFLLDNGFHINHKNNSGRTIFQDVALKGNNKVFQIFLAIKVQIICSKNFLSFFLF